ncbi:MAG: dihydrolipoyl dehydrogenase [Hyphomicrobiaceae bacterium]|nr:MAG: dihydrolipoyl dehydrogenase [Hyphomicrobiaceae bacterium]
MRTVDVAIIGAGSAGIAARSEVVRVTDDYVVIDDGTLGTTCARVGCMPSKSLIQVANDFHRRAVFEEMGIAGASALAVDRGRAMAHVRRLRDAFVDAVLKDMRTWQEHLVRARAHFVDANTLAVGDDTIKAKAVVIATGSRPVMPVAWRPLSRHLLDTDSFFEADTLPDRMAVIGIGAIGTELGLALARLGVDVVAVSTNRAIAGLSSPALQELAAKLLSREMQIRYGRAMLEAGGARPLRVGIGPEAWDVDAALVAVGRRPNMAGLGLDEIGVALDEKGLPKVDPTTMRIENTSIYLAGDASGGRAIFHEAVDEGRMAGFNAARLESHCFQRSPRLAITFSDPNIAVVGRGWQSLTNDGVDFVTGQASFARQGRAVVMGESEGQIEVYVDRKSGKLLGTEMIAPRAEHLAHLLAFALSMNVTVHQFLQMPFYHPAIEEGLRTAVKDAAYKLERRIRDIEAMRCAEPPAGGTV